MPTIRCTIACKKGDNKAFKSVEGGLDSKGVWYNIKDATIPELEKCNKGDVIDIETEKKGSSQYVTKILKAGEAAVATPTAKSETVKSDKPTCEDCGKELKDNKYKKCFDCNKKNPVKKSYKSDGGYKENPEKTAQIQRGNALNAASAVTGSHDFIDEKGQPDFDSARQYTIAMAEALYAWLKA